VSARLTAPAVYALYVLLTFLALPFAFAADTWKSLRDPGQRRRAAERLGFVPRSARPGCLWVHAVSVGEVQAAASVLRELRARHPELPVTLSTVTATGAARAQALFGDTVRQCYLPFDTPWTMRRFLDRVQPRLAVMLETEIWPALYRELDRRGVSLVIGSARLSNRSVIRYRRVSGLIRQTLAGDVLIGAQSPVDAERFLALGAQPQRVHVTGNVKLDLRIPETAIDAGQAFRRRYAPHRPVWVAGSTHEGEEEAALTAHATTRLRHPDALLVIVPRHPQRFEAVRAALRKGGLAFAQRSSGGVPAEGDAVFLLDTLGELQAFYAAADVAFVGGTLVPVGGHNLLEPAVLARPILAGPYTHNAPEIARLLADSGALTIVSDAAELARQVTGLFDDPPRAAAAGGRGESAVAANRGAVDRLVALIEPELRSADGPAASSAS
jgi:3-deoxy-D-manno-octulosonic-acid transferase